MLVVLEVIEGIIIIWKKNSQNMEYMYYGIFVRSVLVKLYEWLV